MRKKIDSRTLTFSSSSPLHARLISLKTLFGKRRKNLKASIGISLPSGFKLRRKSLDHVSRFIIESFDNLYSYEISLSFKIRELGYKPCRESGKFNSNTRRKQKLKEVITSVKDLHYGMRDLFDFCDDQLKKK